MAWEALRVAVGTHSKVVVIVQDKGLRMAQPRATAGQKQKDSG